MWMLRLNFHGIKVCISSSSTELMNALHADFRFFNLAASDAEGADITVSAEHSEIPPDLLPESDAVRQSHTCVSFENDGWLYNDYYGEAVSVLDRRTENARVISPSLHRLHEVCFLLILSRVGKKLDLRGLHKIHAFGVSRAGTHLIGTMPMRGGKSTVLQALLEDPEVALISDDTPLVDRRGRIYPFPLRIGTDVPNPRLEIAPEYLSRFERRQWGTKTLIDIAGLRNPVSKAGSGPVLLFRGIRSRRPGCRIERISRLAMFRELLSSLVIGIGLPMILEYFLENGLRDWPRRTRILISRAIAAFSLSLRCRPYRVYLGPDIEVNRRALAQLLAGETP